ncbi:MAG TPA: AAA family ATPase [Actinocrinis sp.]|nr:AAA family ATPase [Actinocrinis sp.]
MLTGREEEQRIIGDLLARARAGAGGGLLVLGQPGIGKSALLAEAAAAADGMRVLRATGIEAEAGLPYAGLHLLLRPVIKRLPALPEAQRAALGAVFGLTPAGPDRPEPADRLLIGLAVLTLLADLTEHGPVLCLVDDAHWMDASSLAALVFAARRLQDESVAVLFGARDGHGPLDAGGLPILRPAALTEAAAARLLDQRRTALSRADRTRILAQAHGNPLALLELPLRPATPADETLPAPAAAATSYDCSADLPLPDRIQAAFHAQMRVLPDDTQTLLKIAALATSEELDVLLRAAAVLGIPPDAVSPAQQADILLLHQDTYSFRHPLMRAGIAQGAALPKRLNAHRALAAALTGPEDADRRTWHLAAAATGPDEAIAGELERTAERAARRAGPHASVVALERAAQLSGDPGARLRRWILAAEAAADLGDGDRALAFAANADLVLTESALPADAVDAQLLATLALAKAGSAFGRGDLRTAHRLAFDGATALAAAAPRQAAWLLLETVHFAWYLGDREVTEMANLFMTLPLSRDDPLFTVSLYIETGLMLTLRWPLGFEPVRLAAAVDHAAAADYAGPQARIMLATIAPIMAQDTESHAVFADLAADCRAQGRLAWLAPALGGRSRALAYLGRLPEAADAAAEAAAVAQAAGQTQWLSQAEGVLAYLAAARGEEDTCRRHARAALTDLSPTVMSLGAAWGWWALGLLELGLGRPARALEHFHALGRGPSVHQIAALRCLPDLLEAALRAGDRDQAEAAQATLAHWAEEVGQDCARAVALRGRALLADDGTAGDLFEAALSHYEREDRPFDRARTQLLWGEWLRRERRRTEARIPLRAALDTFDQLGAAPWARRARQELAASGSAPGEPAATAAGTAALSALTSQEAHIVRLAAQGLSNRDIAAQLVLSPRTVGHHLYKAYPKLGVLSRGELPALLNR